MDAAQANWLASRAKKPLTKRVQRAWQHLRAAAEAGDEDAIDALRDAWLHDGRDETWPYADEWCPPPVVHAAAVDPARSAESRAALGDYCARHDLVPENPLARVVFFVLTGAHEQYAATDPDGSLLAGAYRVADWATRDALRRIMVDVGELDMVRVIADHPDGALSPEEATYVAGRLATEGDWDRLWRLLPAMPVASAMWAASLFDEHWRPADELGRVFFDRLVTTDADALAALEQAVTEIDVGYEADTPPVTASFSPDNTEFVARGEDVGLFRMPGGDELERVADGDEVLALGGGTIVVGEREYDGWVITRQTEGESPEILLRGADSGLIAAVPDGFVVQADGKLWFGAARGEWSRVVPVALPVGDARLAAADRTSGRLVFAVDDDRVVLTDADLRVLADAVTGVGCEVMAFCDPETILLRRQADFTLELWRRDGTGLMWTAEADADEDVRPVPVLDQVVVRCAGVLTWLDADTLTVVDGPPGLPEDGVVVAFSPDGSLAAVAEDGWVDMHHMGLHRLAALADRALTEAWPSDLDLAAALVEQPLSRRVQDALALLHAGLAHVIGAEVALGGPGRLSGGTDDIALGGR